MKRCDMEISFCVWLLVSSCSRNSGLSLWDREHLDEKARLSPSVDSSGSGWRVEVWDWDCWSSRLFASSGGFELHGSWLQAGRRELRIERLVMSKWSLCSARDGGSMAGSRAPNRARRRRAIDHFVFFIPQLLSLLQICKTDPWDLCLFPFRPHNFQLCRLTHSLDPILLILHSSPCNLNKL